MTEGISDRYSPEQDLKGGRKRFPGLRRAGYARRSGRRAADSSGAEHEVLDFYIRGRRYAVRLEDLRRALLEDGAVLMEEVLRDWKDYLGTCCGLAVVSLSGRGLRIEIFGGGLFSSSLAALRGVIERRERYAVIVEVPEQPVPMAGRDRRIPPGQQRITADA